MYALLSLVISSTAELKLYLIDLLWIVYYCVMGVDPWEDRGTCSLHFGGDAVCIVPLRFRGKHFCTNACGIHWMIGAIFVKFSQLILRKIIKIVATRCQILRPKCTKFNFGWDSAPDRAGAAYSAPQTP